MKFIKEPTKNIAVIWGRPKPKQTTYRPMKFLLKQRVEDGLLLYNVVTSEMIMLNDTEAKMFDGLPGTYNSEMDELIARHFLVKEGFDENKSVLQLRALFKKLNPPKRVNGFTILPTTECNARCYYCFESDHKRCTMTEELASEVVEYITDKCKGEGVEICWFGGEPLVAHKRISQICEGLKKKKIDFSSTMVSNAYLFDEDLVQTAKTEWNLTSIQITLDGTEKVYNETKAYISPKDNPYERVIHNIELLLSVGISVGIRLNVTNNNITDLHVLVEELYSKFGGQRKLSCYSHAVYEGVGFNPLSYDSDTREQIDSQIVALDNKLRKLGFSGSYTRLPSLKKIQCMADNDSCRLIYPDGTIGKCENRSSLDNIGDIYSDITNNEMNMLYKTVEYAPECDDCVLFPNCINLKLCPETGRCSKTKLNWKRSAFVSLMKDYYQKHKSDCCDNNNYRELLTDCEV